MPRRRAVIAGVFAVLYPGLGHIYLREWLRALSWFGLALLTAALVVPADFVTAFESGGLARLFEVSQTLPLASLSALLLVRLLNVVDAVRLALTPRQIIDDPDTVSCPECGGQIDPELDFCHWCTARLDQPAETGPGGATGNRFH